MNDRIALKIIIKQIKYEKCRENDDLSLKQARTKDREKLLKRGY
jgi:hypothetical protein